MSRYIAYKRGNNTAASALAATLWQVAHPPEALARVYADDPTIAPTWALDFVPS
jgi:hypothetical protein